MIGSCLGFKNQKMKRENWIMITTTLNRIRNHSPCEDRWRHLLISLGKTKADDETLPYSEILKHNGFSDALWCCRAEPQYGKEWRLFAVWCARRVQHLMTDKRSLYALDFAERYAYGAASEEELAAVRAAAWDASWGSDNAAARNAANFSSNSVAWEDAWGAAWASAKSVTNTSALEAARDTANAAARAAAWGAARGAAWNAANSAAWDSAWSATNYAASNAVNAAAIDSAYAAARNAAWDAQALKFLEIVGV